MAALSYQLPVLGMDFHGSAGASAAPFCSSSMEMLSGERTNAMRPSRGGRNFGHLAYAVDDIYATCQRLADHGVTVLRPPP